MGSDPDSARSAVCLAASVPKRKQDKQLLLQSANPRANHTMRTMPPSVSAGVLPRARRGHVGHCQKPCWMESPEANEAESHLPCQQLSTLPMRMGGLGLRSAARCAPAAYWASWADALHMISQRTPDVAHDVLRRLNLEEPIGGCLGELRDASSAFGPQGLLVETIMARVARGQAPSEDRDSRARRVAHTVGSIGLLASLTPPSGRARC